MTTDGPGNDITAHPLDPSTPGVWHRVSIDLKMHTEGVDWPRIDYPKLRREIAKLLVFCLMTNQEDTERTQEEIRYVINNTQVRNLVAQREQLPQPTQADLDGILDGLADMLRQEPEDPGHA